MLSVVAAALLALGSPIGETELIVTTTSDSPGGAGLTLREAIEAANDDPGAYTIRFAPSLRGKTITLDFDLPALAGGGVTIEGEGITLRTRLPALRSPCGGCAFLVASSGNRLQGLTLAGFNAGVRLVPASPGDVLADNTVVGLDMRRVGEAGIYLSSAYRPSCGRPKPRSCASHSRWLRTTLAGNTIESRGELGIGLAFQSSVGDTAEGVSITGNRITMTRRDSIAIDLSSGFWVGSTKNRISDLLIARNRIEARGIGIRVYGGEAGAPGNLVEHVRIRENRLHLVRPGAAYCCVGISVGLADEATHRVAPGLRPIRYPDRNVARDVEIAGNTVTGTLVTGISIAICCEGGSYNRIENVRIRGNTVTSSTTAAGVLLLGGDSDSPQGAERGNRITGVTIAGNRVTVSRRGPPPQVYVGGVVAVAGGGWTSGHVIRNVRVSSNRIATPLTGIDVVAGIFNARGNAVGCVRLSGNRISGTRTPVSIRAGTPGNRATLGC